MKTGTPVAKKRGKQENVAGQEADRGEWLREPIKRETVMKLLKMTLTFIFVIQISTMLMIGILI